MPIWIAPCNELVEMIEMDISFAYIGAQMEKL
jgi:hypothetical protein